MPVDELFLNGAVESLEVAVGLGMLGIIKEVDEAILLARLSKVFFEFTTVVSLDSGSDEGCNCHKFPEEISAVSRGVGFIGISEGKSATHVNGGKYIAFDTGSKDSHGVHLHEVARVLR